MKIMYISRAHSGKPIPFVIEQANSIIRNYPVEISQYFIPDGIFNGYVKTIFRLPTVLKKHRIDIAHVHNGLSAFIVILSKIIFYKSLKVVITFHGSDLNEEKRRRFSLFASKFSSHNIIVSKKMAHVLNTSYSIIPCGIDTDVDLNYRDNMRQRKNWGPNEFVILFSSNFNRIEKDSEFAFKVVDKFRACTQKVVHFIELNGFSRHELTQLMQAADCLIMCSIMEGSPQVIKEAVLNSLPVISNDVGDVAEIVEGVDNCFIVNKEVNAYVERLIDLLNTRARVKNRLPVLEKYDNNKIAANLYKIYNQL